MFTLKAGDGRQGELQPRRVRSRQPHDCESYSRYLRQGLWSGRVNALLGQVHILGRPEHSTLSHNLAVRWLVFYFITRATPWSEIKSVLEPNHPSPLKVGDNQVEIRLRDRQIMRECTVIRRVVFWHTISSTDTAQLLRARRHIPFSRPSGT